MDKNRLHIAIVEPSTIIYEGLSTLLLKSEKRYDVYRITDLEELNVLAVKEHINCVILNPVVVQNRLKDYTKLRKQLADSTWFGLIYSYYDAELLNRFDGLISISDTMETIYLKINNAFNQSDDSNTTHEQLSERETDVLIHLVNGQSNKEIADKLNISIHTVISHRKNIMEKTGIKSLSGLTIYSISKKIIPLDTTTL